MSKKKERSERIVTPVGTLCAKVEGLEKRVRQLEGKIPAEE